jgi:hypothetical protein
VTLHTWYFCKQPCERQHCPYCEGGLASCTVCDCAEGTLPSDCPGSPVSSADQDRIYAGRLDFTDGAWSEGVRSKYLFTSEPQHGTSRSESPRGASQP